jgi:hypothetical protein
MPPGIHQHQGSRPGGRATFNAQREMNRFYRQPKSLQWIEAVLLLLIGFFPALFIIELGYEQPLYYALFILYVPIGQFASTPLFRLSGIYTYYSPMLLGYNANAKQIDLHSGGSFDYLFVMRQYKAGVETRNALLIYYLEGLLHVIGLIENKSVPDTVNVVGTSYFFNQRTLQRMGFEVQTPSWFYRLNLLVNFIDLTWMYSVSQGRFAIPKLWDAKKASVSGGKLLESKQDIEALYMRMKSKTAR